MNVLTRAYRKLSRNYKRSVHSMCLIQYNANETNILKIILYFKLQIFVCAELRDHRFVIQANCFPCTYTLIPISNIISLIFLTINEKHAKQTIWKNARLVIFRSVATSTPNWKYNGGIFKNYSHRISHRNLNNFQSESKGNSSNHTLSVYYELAVILLEIIPSSIAFYEVQLLDSKT